MPDDLSAALIAAADRLQTVSDTPRLDAELLMAHALGIDRGDMLLRRGELAVPPGFAALLERRLAHEPVAYITGERDFWTLSLRVGPGTLIPRPDSETLIEAAETLFADGPPPARILDLGTGSGALLLAALSLFGGAQGLGVDASEDALGVARANAARCGMEGRALLERRDWTQAGWADGLGRFDLVLCNPPYVEEGAALAPQVARYEPASALYAGQDGLDAYRVLIPQLGGLMRPGGRAVIELGAGQYDRVAQIARKEGFETDFRRDLAGHRRALIIL